jgi:hypothetical protein
MFQKDPDIGVSRCLLWYAVVWQVPAALALMDLAN